MSPSGRLPTSCLIIFLKLSFSTACTTANSFIHLKIDNCNSLVLNLPATQTNRLQLVINSAAHAVIKTSKFHYSTPILKSLDWLKINERIKCKVLSLTIGQPCYLCSLRSCHSHPSTCFSSLINLSRPSHTSRLEIANRSHIFLLLFCGTISI